jgi:hypothetical protein
MPYKSLADGYLPTTVGALYTVDRTVSVRSINIFNTNAAAQTVLIYVHRKGRPTRKLRRVVLEENWSSEVLENELNLSVGDIIEGITTTGSAVEFVITGIERDPK